MKLGQLSYSLQKSIVGDIQKSLTQDSKKIESLESSKKSTMQISGIPIEGLTLDAISDALLEVSIPLSIGNHQFPALYGDAQVQIGDKATAKLKIHLVRDSKKGLMIDDVVIKFSEPICITNPVMAFLPKPTGLKGVWHSLKNMLAYAKISEVTIDKTGKVAVGGSIVKAGLTESPIKDELEHPIIVDLSLKHLEDSFVGSESDVAQKMDLGKFIEKLGGLCSQATYHIDAHIASPKIGEGDKQVELWDHEGQLEVSVGGDWKIKKNQVHFDLVSDKIDTKNKEGDLKFSGEFCLTAKKSEANIDFFVNSKAKDLKYGLLQKNIRVHLNDSETEFRGNVNLKNTKQGYELNGKDLRLKVVATNPKFGWYDMDAYLRGETEAGLYIKNLSYRRGDSGVEASGGFGYKVTPSEEALRVFPDLPAVLGRSDFELHEDGRAQIRCVKNGILPLISPYSPLTSYKNKMLSPVGKSVGAIGSKELCEYLEKVTGSEIRDDNQVELLVDGVMSFPKRLELIEKAEKSICLQTLVFKDDKTGMLMAKALADAAKRGVTVRVIVDSLGSIDHFAGIMKKHKAYELMKRAGVDLRIYNDRAEKALRQMIEVVLRNPQIEKFDSMDELRNPIKMVRLLYRATAAYHHLIEPDLSIEDTELLAEAFTNLLGEAPDIKGSMLTQMLDSPDKYGIDVGGLISVLFGMAVHNKVWHEKYLIVDGAEAIVGGMNTGDSYLLGGTGEKYTDGDTEKIPWRDTDVWLKGPIISDIGEAFKKNWQDLTKEEISIETSDKIELSKKSGKKVQFLQHSPWLEQDHNINNVIIECLKSLKNGEQALIENAYFLPSSSLTPVKEALIDAAKRGVDVRIFTNGASSSDLPRINEGVIPYYREMLGAGVRIFERTDQRTMHSKCAVFGGEMAIVGSSNLENRSAIVSSEDAAVIYDSDFAKQMEKMFFKDLEEANAKEMLLKDIETLPLVKEIQSTLVSMLGDLL